MKFFSFYISLCLMFCLSCGNKIREFTINDIVIPDYYRKYDYVKYWEKKGGNFGILNKENYSKGFYKDSDSKNFLSISETLPNILKMDFKTRFEILKQQINFDRYEANSRFEIYHSVKKRLFFKKPITIYYALFLNKKDDVGISINFSSYDNDQKKFNDYQKIVSSLKKKCVEGYIFKSTEKRNKLQSQL